MTSIAHETQHDPKLILGRMFAETYGAFLECSEEVQGAIRDLVLAWNDPEVDAHDRQMALSAIAEALFPSKSGPDGHCGFDLAEDEGREGDGGRQIVDAMDQQEAQFGARVSQALQERGWTQDDLAQRIGIGQPTVSLLLSRQARPQRRTVEKIARAFGITPESLWPDLAD